MTITFWKLLPLLVVLGAGARLEAASNVPDPKEFLRDFYATYNAKGVARLSEFYTADATFADPSFELDLKGRDQIRDLLTKGLAKYESLDWEITHTIKAGDELVVEGIMIGKLKQKTVRVPFVSVFQFKDGKIAAQRDMFDVLHFFTQLGARMIREKQ